MQWKLALMSVLVCVMSLSHAEVYKWVDDNGKVHYSDSQKNSNAESIKVRPPSSDSDYDQKQLEQQRRGKRDKLLRAFEEERRIKNETAAQQKKEQQERERECAKAKKQLAYMQGGGVFYDKGENGKKKYLSDADVVKRIAAWKKAVAHWCG